MKPGRKANHCPPFSDEVKHKWIYSSILTFVLRIECLITRTILPLNPFILNVPPGPDSSTSYTNYNLGPHIKGVLKKIKCI
jgi:hypothetical protein